jgi:hypothetical protein
MTNKLKLIVPKKFAVLLTAMSFQVCPTGACEIAVSIRAIKSKQENNLLLNIGGFKQDSRNLFIFYGLAIV